jgi:hypothetical protein
MALSFIFKIIAKTVASLDIPLAVDNQFLKISVKTVAGLDILIAVYHKMLVFAL